MHQHDPAFASSPGRAPGARSHRERGQIIVIFAGAMLAMVALCALVIDVAWYWTGNLRMQRAADAAALAGVVWLPGNTGSAYSTARAEAKKNGYEDGVGGIVVTPVQDATNSRRLKVTITGPVGTFFARVIGINAFPGKREAKADYVLPVPMGSPENYYGVGFYESTAGPQTVPDPAGGTLASQGFWGAIFTSGGWRENGDKYAPSLIGNGTGAPPGSASPTYDAAGYDYTIELPGGSAEVRLFDPMFCATGDNHHGGWLGAGDHWTSPGNIAPVSITYRLYNTRGTLLDTSDDGPPVQTLAYDPGNATMGDLGGAFGTPQNSGSANRQDCSANPAHNRWVTMASGLLGGTYRLNVNTSLQAANGNVGAENLFSIWARSSGSARVYGGGRMAAYTNLDTGQQKFYFAQIERVHAGKTMVIHLFDPGETNGNAFLRLLSPDGNVYHRQVFDWTSDDGRSGTGVTEIQTSNGTPLFNNREITIEVALPATYGQTGLNPPGDVTDEDGWWLIEYQLANGNDTTTWSVDLRGNPVHLVLP